MTKATKPGQMQQTALLVSDVLEHARRWHGSQEISSFPVDEAPLKLTFADCAGRASQLAHALGELGIGAGDAISIIAWNTHRHLETWYAASGIGAISHSVNPRLTPEQAAFTVNAAQSRVMFTDLTFAPLAIALARMCDGIERLVVMTDPAHMPQDAEGALCYDALLEGQPTTYDWPRLDENAANAICFTSGTTGNPKGVVYSHRSNILHGMAVAAKDAANIGALDVILPAAPLFHANGWGIPYAAFMFGAKLVLAGRAMDGVSLHERIVEEGVTITLGVPTVWMDMLAHMCAKEIGAGALETVVIAGSAAPASMIEEFKRDHDVNVRQCWGMTETSPIGTSSLPVHNSVEETVGAASKQGRPVFGVDIRLLNEETGEELPHDGRAAGRLQVRGPWVLDRYLNAESDAVDTDGWFDTGDIATIDAQGSMQITDRAKDLIKSGGEWISSVDLENAAMGMDGVFQAAAVGVPHPRWDERPILFIVREEDNAVEADDVLQYLSGKVAKLWLPDAVIFVEQLPLAATGKVRKTELRDAYAGHLTS